MNIGIVTTWFERGAAYVSLAYEQILSGQNQVFIYARAGERYAQGDPKWDKPNVTWGKKFPDKIVTFVDWQDFKTWVRNNNLEVVIFNEQHSWEVILKALAKLDITIGAYIDYYKAETVPFFHLYDFLLCNTRRHFSVFKDFPGALYLPWGTDLKLFRPEWSDSDREIIFFHSCGVSPLRKGTDLVVKAFMALKGSSKLIIHSQWPLSEYPELTDLIASDARIELIEKEVGAPGLYHLGDVYVYPSRLEGIGLTIAEALASGLPVITTDNPPMNEFVEPGVTGSLVAVERFARREDDYYWPESYGSEKSLAAAMQYYVDNTALIKLYRQNARYYAETHLDWAVNTRGLSDFILKVRQAPRQEQPDLMRTVAKFEKAACGRAYPYLPRPLVGLLSQMGAGRLRRALKGQPKRDKQET